MPRIDPHQLLKCLSVLLSPTGGVKSKDEVQRLANLMTKFSKKLVSKCIYVSILKATDIKLLNMFMAAGGWDLTFSWLSDGVSARNWPLVNELVELLLMCPVDIDRLKTNSCPKLIKTLSKDLTAEQYVRDLACRLVEQWLRIVRGDDAPILPSRIDEPSQSQEDIAQQECSIKQEDESSQDKSTTQETEETDGHLPKYKITIRDGKQILAEINNKVADDDSGTETSVVDETEPPSEEIEEDDDDDEDYVIKPVRLNKKPGATRGRKPAAKVVKKKERESTDSGGSTGKTSKGSSKPAAKKSKVVEEVKTKAEGKKSKAADQVKGKGAKSKTEEPKIKEGASSKKVKEPEEASGTKHKDTGKLNLSLKSRKRLVTEKEHGKFDKLHAKDKSKERNSIMDMDTLTDKEKETLSKFITPPISKLGKIPKKSSTSKEEKPLDDKSQTSKDAGDVKKQSESKKDEHNKHDLKKIAKSPIPEVKKEKKWSIEPKRALPTDQKPKTAKIYSAKFRSTGLEEEVTKPPSRKDIKDNPKKERPPPPLLPPPLSLSDKKPLKRSSPPPPEIHIPEKRVKPDSPVDEKKSVEKPGIKLIPPKPRPMFLQESDVFMDAMLAANTLKEPRKRKRKGSISKEHSDPKKDGGSPNHSPASGGIEEPITSPSAVKPTFKFYQDTMDTSLEEDKAEDKDDENLEFAEPISEETGDDRKSMSSEEDKSIVPRRDSGGMKGVLVHLKTRKQKKSVTWKEIGLEAIRYFELDENERVNVTKNFADMKNQEKELERENFLIARKLAAEDIMEERTRWQALIPIDMSAAAAVVAAGKNSQEKDIQYAREKTVSPAIYFNRKMIPDTPAEPDLEIHATTDPAVIPLEDITGSVDSTNDFTNTPWPEPKGAPPSVPVPVPPPGPGPFPVQGGPPGPFPPMPGPGPFMPGPPGPGMPMPPGGDWRNADGNVVDIPPGPPGMFPGPMMPPGMPMPMMMPMMPLPPNMNPEDMPPGPPFHPGPFPLMGPGPFPGPPGPPGPQGNWQGPPPGPPNGPNWDGPPNGPNWDGPQQGPPSQGGDRGGRYQGGGGGSWRGSRGSGGNRNTDNWRGNSGRTPLCNKGNFCRNNNCRFRHPR